MSSGCTEALSWNISLFSCFFSHIHTHIRRHHRKFGKKVNRTEFLVWIRSKTRSSPVRLLFSPSPTPFPIISFSNYVALSSFPALVVDKNSNFLFCKCAPLITDLFIGVRLLHSAAESSMFPILPGVSSSLTSRSILYFRLFPLYFLPVSSLSCELCCVVFVKVLSISPIFFSTRTNL